MTVLITNEDLDRLKLRKSPLPNMAFNPLLSCDFDHPSNNHRQSLTDIWTDTTTSKIKSDIAFFLNGEKGSGKSYINVTLGYCSALHLAEKLGGNWSDWYNMDLTAIIDPYEQMELLKLEAKYVVKNYDDRSIGYDSHKWQSKENATQNNMNITNRTENNIQLTSSPDQGYVDKRARELCNYYGEAERILPALRHGMNVARIFKVSKNPRTGKRYYTSIWHNECKLVRACIGKSDAALKRLFEEYDIKRAENVKKLLRGDFEDVLGPGKNAKNISKINGRTQKAMDNAFDKGVEYYRLVEQGWSHKEALSDIQILDTTWNKWKAAGWVNRDKCLGLDKNIS